MTMSLEWNKSISVGDATLDEQHQQLFSQINSLADAVSESEGERVVSDIVAFLGEYVADHFSHEESYMERHGYPQLEQHRRLHEEFSRQYEEMKKELERGESRVFAERVENFLGHWWINHVTIEDKKYERYITGHPGSHPQDEPEDYHDQVQF